MIKYSECETCAQSDKRYCIGCQPLRKTDGTYSRTGWIAKPGIKMTVTSLAYPVTEKKRTMEASNAQMMREAFDEILCRIDAWRTDGTMEHWQYSQLFDIADAALALPLHNCDVGTAEEQVERFKAYCESNMQYFRDMFGTHEGAGGWDCREDCPVGKMIDKNDSLSDHCELVWAQMPYAAEEGADE